MGDTLSLDIRAEQLTTAYELAKDEGLQGDELNAVVVRHLEAARRAALEEACRAICDGCRNGEPVRLHHNGRLEHRTGWCAAWVVRALGTD